MNIIKCLVVDDHVLLRQGVRRLLEGEVDFKVVADVGSASEAVEQVRNYSPDVVLMDIEMAGMSSFEAVRTMREDCPDTRVLFLTMHEDEESMMQSFKAGAAGYVLKDTPAPELFGAVREVYRGGTYFSPRVLGRMVAELRLRPGARRSKNTETVLTPREREVVKLLAEGNSVRKVADRLGLSAKTVEAHKFNLMRKLDIHNKAQLVTYAIQKKIVDVPVIA